MLEQKRKVIDYLVANSESNGSVRFSNDTYANFLSTSFGTMIYYLIGQVDSRDESKLIQYWGIKDNAPIENIIDPSFSTNDLIGRHKPDYVLNQITYFSLLALDVIGVQLRGNYVEESYLGNSVLLERWFNSLDLSRFWYESNKIMFMLYFLSYINRYSGQDRSKKAIDSIHLIMQLLNESQDKVTGFWGTNLNNNNLYDGCYGTAHVLMYYDYFEYEIPYVKQILDNTLSLHNENGLLGSKYGGACEDYDAIEIYLRCGKQTDYRKNDIELVLIKMKELIEKSQNRDGGFSYKITDSFVRKQVYTKLIKKKYSYSGWNKMTTNPFESGRLGYMV